MSAVAIDTSVLLAIFKGEAEGALWLEKLQQLAETAALRLSPVVLAEVRSFFASDEACLKALDSLADPVQRSGEVIRRFCRNGFP